MKPQLTTAAVPTTSDPPYPISPSDSVEGVRPTFAWDGIGGGIEYGLIVRNAAGTVVVDTLVSTTAWTSSNPLTAGEAHTWQVRGRNGAGWTAFSDPLSFTPMPIATAPPGPPALIAPSGCIPEVRPTFTWSAPTGIVDHYKIKVTQVSPEQLRIYLNVDGTSFVPPSDLLPGVQYRWSVKAINSVGETWSANPELYFTPECTPPNITVADGSVVEGTGGTTTATFTVSLSRASTAATTIGFATGDWTGSSPATSGGDYTPVSGTITFAAGETAKTLSIDVVADAIAEDHEKFVLNLSSPTNGVIVDAQAVMTIVADDSSNWRIKGVGDFDRDGKADIVWRFPPLASDPNQSGPNAVWRMNGANRASAASLTAMNNAYETLSGVNDADADGDADIWWRNSSTRQIRLWTQEDATRVNSLFVSPDGSTLTDYDLVGVFDMGDGLYGPGPTPNTSPSAVATYDAKGDFVWRHKTSGALVVWYMNGYTRYNGIGESQAGLSDLNFRIVGAGDFNNDGHTDFVWQHAITRQLVIWYMNGFRRLVNGDPACYDDGSGLTKCAKNTEPAEEETADWNVVGVGDFDADGKPDLLWRHYYSGSDAIWFMDGFRRITPSRTLLNPDPFN